MPEPRFTRVSVHLLDDEGRVRVVADGEGYTGKLSRLPVAVREGEAIGLQLCLVGGDESTPPAHDVELRGVIEGLEGERPLKAGVVFDLRIAHVSHRPDGWSLGPVGTTDTVVDGAHEPDRLEDSLPSLPIRRHPAPHLLDEPFTMESHDESAFAGETFRIGAPLPFKSTAVSSAVGGPGSDAERDPATPSSTSGLHVIALPVAGGELAAAEDNDVDPSPRAPETRADSDEVTTPRRRRRVSDLSEPSGIMGTLRQMTLAELVQSLEFSGKTAGIEVLPKDSSVREGRVYLRRGRVVFVSCGDLEGEEAFFLLSDLQRGAFYIRFGEEAPRTNIDKPTAYLLLEALRRKDEEGRVEATPASHEGDEPSGEGASCADDNAATTPFGLRPRDLDSAEPHNDAFAAAAGSSVEYELDDLAMEEALVVAVELKQRPGATWQLPVSGTTPVFAHFFAEAQHASNSGEMLPSPAIDDVEEGVLRSAWRRLAGRASASLPAPAAAASGGDKASRESAKRPL